MSEPTNVHVISLVLAGSMLVGGWYLIESSNQPSAPAMSVQQPSAASTNPTTPPPAHATTTPTSSLANQNVTYKCQKAGRISFSDQPCAAKETTLTVTATEKEAPPTTNNLAQLKQQAAQMEADRLDRERRYAAVRTFAPSPTASNANLERTIRCPQIDREIVAKDAELRQPHSPQWGDMLTEQRRKLMDERFSLGC
jgi:hypothetical protein